MAAKLLNQDQIHDQIPEIYKGYNVSDFIHPDVSSKLKVLAEEERERDESGFYDLPMLPDDEEARQRRQMVKLIRDKKIVARRQSQLKAQSAPPLARKARKSALLTKQLLKKTYKDSGRYFNKTLEKLTSLGPEKVNRTGNLVVRGNGDTGMNIEMSEKQQLIAKASEKSNKKVNKQTQSLQEKQYTKYPKHLYTGKVNSTGKRDRRWMF